jgi:hypothetical protein
MHEIHVYLSHYNHVYFKILFAGQLHNDCNVNLSPMACRNSTNETGCPCWVGAINARYNMIDDWYDAGQVDVSRICKMASDSLHLCDTAARLCLVRDSSSSYWGISLTACGENGLGVIVGGLGWFRWSMDVIILLNRQTGRLRSRPQREQEVKIKQNKKLGKLLTSR